MARDPQDMVGQIFGGYQLDRILGGGGMGVVFLGHEIADPTHIVAIKVLQPSWQMLATPGRRQMQQRFANEAEILRQLRHPHILRLLASGEEDGLLYMVLPYIAGKTLAERIAIGPLPLDEVARIGGQVADALAYAHNLGIIHRDIKPSNILLDDQDNVYLADFSIAKIFDLEGTTLTGTGQVLGTLGYMAPEQMLGQTATARSDEYGLGVLLFELVTGRPLAQVQSGRHVLAPRDLRPDLPPAASDAILRALSEEPDDHFPTVAAFAQAFAAGLHAPPMPGNGTTMATPPPPSTITMGYGHEPTIVAAPATSPSLLSRAWGFRALGVALAILVVMTSVILIAVYSRNGGLVGARVTSTPKPTSTLTSMPTPAPGSLRWSYTTGGSVLSSPTVANRVVYIGSDDHQLYALNALDGSVIWSFMTGDLVRSSPTIVDGAVYVGSKDGYVYALNLNNGSLRWKYDTHAHVYSQLVVSNGIIYVAAIARFFGNDGFIEAINSVDGALKWEVNGDEVAAIANNVIYVYHGGGTGIEAYNATNGALIWRDDFGNGYWIDGFPFPRATRLCPERSVKDGASG